MVTSKTNNEIYKLRSLMRKHKIHIRSVSPKSAWPQEHVPLFQKVVDADRLWFDEYLKSSGLSLEEKDCLKSKVDGVIGAVNSCRQDLDIEITWRGRIEGYIIDRFSKETNCKKCSRAKLCSGARYLPTKSFEAQELESRPRIQRTCECIASENYVDSYESGGENIFNDKSGTTILYANHEALCKEGVSEKGPDRIVGLAVTPSIEKCIEHRTELKHFPFKDPNHQKLVYPFLLVEAKSEKGSSGFEFIEAQSAFPIMAMLDRQAQLPEDPEGPMSPLVWFIAYAGCDFRIYGCVKTLAGYEIFELWQGSLCYHDKVFRLFYIMDLLCDWARQYRRTIQSRLVPDQQLRREWTPASTTISSQDMTRRVSVSHGTPLLSADTEERSHELRFLSGLGSPTDSVRQSGGFFNDYQHRDHVIQSSSVHRFRDDFGRLHRVLIRHIDTVKFRFQLIIVPNQTAWLRSSENPRMLQGSMKALLTKGHFTSLSSKAMETLEADWLGERLTGQISYSEADQFCLFKLDTFFDPEDMLPVRSLSCLSMSTAVMESIIEEQATRNLVSRTSKNRSKKTVQDFVEMGHSLNRRDSLYSCLLGWNYHLVPGEPFSMQLFHGSRGVRNTVFKAFQMMYANGISERTKTRITYPGSKNLPVTIPEDFGTQDHMMVQRTRSVDTKDPDLVVLVASDDISDRDKTKHRLPEILQNIIEYENAYRAEERMQSVGGPESLADRAVRPSSETLQLAESFCINLEQQFQRESPELGSMMMD